MTNHETAVPTEIDRLHAEILEGRAQISELRGLLRSENQRANAAIDRETTAEQGAIEAEEQARRLGLMVDEYGAGASALTDKLWRVRDLHRKTCLVARSDVPPTSFTCGLCEVLDAPAAVSVPPPAPRADAGRRERYAAAIADGFRAFDADTTSDAYLDAELLDAVVAVADAEEAVTLREAADELWALANRLTERGQGVLWAAEWLRRRADCPQPVGPCVAGEQQNETQRLALSEALGLGTSAPWDAIRDRAAELAAGEQP